VILYLVAKYSGEGVDACQIKGWFETRTEAFAKAGEVLDEASKVHVYRVRMNIDSKKTIVDLANGRMQWKSWHELAVLTEKNGRMSIHRQVMEDDGWQCPATVVTVW
jgi:nitrogen-specific signal transduction histidine kinase